MGKSDCIESLSEVSPAGISIGISRDVEFMKIPASSLGAPSSSFCVWRSSCPSFSALRCLQAAVAEDGNIVHHHMTGNWGTPTCTDDCAKTNANDSLQNK